MTAHVVVLVHGTWGRSFIPFARKKVAPWCDVKSPLRNAVVEGLGSDVVFEPFSWSGANTVGARFRAAGDLAERVKQLSAEFPGAQIHIIAHSHAGNATLYALRELGNTTIATVVFLSTPFLLVEPRSLGEGFGHKIVAAGVSLAQVGLPFALMYRAIDDFSPLLIFGAFLGSAALIFLAIALWRRQSRWLRETVEAFRFPSTIKARVLIIRMAGDEAAGVLGSAQFLSQLITHVFRMGLAWMPEPRQVLLSIKAFRCGPWWSAYFTIGVIVMITAGVLSFMEMPDEVASSIAVVGRVGLFIYLTPLIAMWWAFPATVILSVLLALLLVPFGPRFALAGLGVQLTAEATPPGEWNVVQLGHSPEPLEKQTGLRHGTHSDPVALAALGRFLRQCARKG